MTALTLPWPPTVNHYWTRTRSGSLALTKRARTYRKEVWAAWKQERCLGIHGRIGILLIAYPPDKRVRDLDNILKALLDALKHAGAYEDDGCIDELKITRGPVCKGGGVLVDFWETKEPF